MISNSNSSVCFTGFTNMNQTFPVAISETRGSTVNTAANTRFPLRGGGYTANFDIPLYVGGPRPPGPLGLFERHEDVGSVAAVGAGSCYDDDTSTYFVDGSGYDIWYSADGFQFVDTTWNGDGTIIAKVNSADNPTGSSGWSKCGVMFRNGTGAGALFVDMVVTNSQGVWMMERPVANNGATCSGTNLSLRPPCWVMLQRTGTSYIGSTSTDGNTWTQLGATSVNIPSTANAGLCVTSHVNNGLLSRSIMSNVSFSEAVNCGGTAAGPFRADAYYSGGATLTSTNSIDTSAVIDPAPQAVYQSNRYYQFFYTLGGYAPSQNCLVRLHFAETHFTAAGQRKFSVQINGTPALTNFDIFANAGGANKACIEEFEAQANSLGQFLINFNTGSGDVNNPQCNGIEIVQLP